MCFVSNLVETLPMHPLQALKSFSGLSVWLILYLPNLLLNYGRWSSFDLSRMVGRHVGSPSVDTPGILTYSRAVLHSIGKTQPKLVLPRELWLKLDELGIRKRFRSKRGGRIRKKPGIEPVSPSESDHDLSVPYHLPSSYQTPWFPGILLANLRSLRSKVDELQAVVNFNLPGIVLQKLGWTPP